MRHRVLGASTLPTTFPKILHGIIDDSLSVRCALHDPLHRAHGQAVVFVKCCRTVVILKIFTVPSQPVRRCALGCTLPRPDQQLVTTREKLRKRLRRLVSKALVDFSMLEAGDRVMVCLSGGKDSYTLLDMLLQLQRIQPLEFELCAVNLDQKQPDFPTDVLPNYLRGRDIPFHILEQDTYSVVKRVIPEGRTMCSLCSRLRRGALYGYAAREGFNKIALGHHRDDLLETFFLNIFHGGKLQTMSPKLRSDDGKHQVIRPLAYCCESDIAAYAKWQDFPIIPCNLCGNQTHLQRVAIKRMLREWERQSPGRIHSIFAALQNVGPSHLLDRNLYNFESFARSGSAPEPSAPVELDRELNPFAEPSEPQLDGVHTLYRF